MYRILMTLEDYSYNMRGMISFIIGLILATVLFMFVIGPLHNLIQAKVIKANGDDWVEDAGYFSMNPSKSFHWIGLLSVFVVFMGFTKRVRYRRRYFHAPVLGTIGVSFSGILTYFLSGVLLVFGYTLIGSFNFYGMTNPSVMPSEELSFWGCVFHTVFSAVFILSRMCIYSAFFNLIPIPPMDMGEMLFTFIGRHWSDVVKKNDLVISVGLFVIAFFVLGMPDSVLVKSSFNVIGMLEDAFGFIIKIFT